MSHDEIRRQFDARLDHELSPEEVTAFDAHLDGCAECRTAFERRKAVVETVYARAESYRAPAGLREMLVKEAQVARAPHPESPSRAERGGDEGALDGGARPFLSPSPAPARSTGRRVGSRNVRWLAMAASLAIVAAGSWQLSANHARGQLMSEVVLESHVRSLLGTHLTDVTSTDQHTVKPWFNGKVDFSPPVYDFAGRGYPLLGGRLEYLGGQQVAALVYERRKHLINVFLWPTSSGNTAGPASKAMNGYHMLHMTRPDFTYWIVSDLGSRELEEFSGLLMGADTAVAM